MRIVSINLTVGSRCRSDSEALRHLRNCLLQLCYSIIFSSSDAKNKLRVLLIHHHRIRQLQQIFIMRAGLGIAIRTP
ncbi:hypothetical protein D3C71_1926550 [compost metagenome]